MSEHLRYWSRVCNTPANARKPIEGGRLKGKTDISPMWRIRMLTEMFGPCGIGWKIEVVDKEMIPGDGSEVRAFVHLNLYFREGEQWSEPVPGFGGSSYTTKEQFGVYTDDECYKKAFTDAFGSACKLLGFSEDIFTGSYDSKYDKRDKYDKREQQPEQRAKAAQKAGPEMMPVTYGPYQGMTYLEAYRKDSRYFFGVLRDPNTPPEIKAAIQAAANKQ